MDRVEIIRSLLVPSPHKTPIDILLYDIHKTYYPPDKEESRSSFCPLIQKRLFYLKAGGAVQVWAFVLPTLSPST